MKRSEIFTPEHVLARFDPEHPLPPKKRAERFERRLGWIEGDATVKAQLMSMLDRQSAEAFRCEAAAERGTAKAWRLRLADTLERNASQRDRRAAAIRARVAELREAMLSPEARHAAMLAAELFEWEAERQYREAAERYDAERTQHKAHGKRAHAPSVPRADDEREREGKVLAAYDSLEGPATERGRCRIVATRLKLREGTVRDIVRRRRAKNEADALL
jgi:hypothetical protein